MRVRINRDWFLDIEASADGHDHVGVGGTEREAVADLERQIAAEWVAAMNTARAVALAEWQAA